MATEAGAQKMALAQLLSRISLEQWETDWRENTECLVWAAFVRDERVAQPTLSGGDRYLLQHLHTALDGWLTWMGGLAWLGSGPLSPRVIDGYTWLVTLPVWLEHYEAWVASASPEHNWHLASAK